MVRLSETTTKKKERLPKGTDSSEETSISDQETSGSNEPASTTGDPSQNDGTELQCRTASEESHPIVNLSSLVETGSPVSKLTTRSSLRLSINQKSVNVGRSSKDSTSSKERQSSETVSIKTGQADEATEPFQFDRRILAQLQKNETTQWNTRIITTWNGLKSIKVFSGQIPHDTRRTMEPLTVCRKLSDTEYLASVLRKPLANGDKTRRGYIYAYWFPGPFGQVKIGHTETPVETRLKRWKRDCKHDPQRIHLTNSDEAVMIPHPDRTERLIHAELRRFQHKEPECSGCRGCHKEWFLVPGHDYVRTVVAKWIKWIATSPYDLTSGQLKDQSEKTIAQLCEHVPRLQPPTRSSPRSLIRPPTPRAVSSPLPRSSTPMDIPDWTSKLGHLSFSGN